ncbi:TRAP transporter small permease [Desulfoferrobacter suflitae]|uniref:TRAP transporter small permease n=1 Tax=Desulfoferrobacter suflitae TaxID=2865782 RepID=UPI0021648DB2|nr:TRAP transporter small permease [Desulfoferrobacter suflitae]MCK8601462.1 TRAP transporter small permease [Desulfoferrobacter suflitae]
MECQPPLCSDPPKTRVPLELEENLGGIIIAVLAVITFANVVVRYLTNLSFAFTEELSIFLMVVMTLVGSSSLMAKGGHLSITFFVDLLPAKNKRRAVLMTQMVTCLTFLVLAGLGARMAWDEYRFEVTSPGLGIPTWIYTVWMPILFLLITARAVGVIIRTWKRIDR